MTAATVDRARPDDEVRRFIERFALLLTEGGVPRMPARVFACLLAEDTGRLTASELADRLDVSAAAISSAVRYLTQTDMLVRGREPGERRDHYRLHANVWTDMFAGRDALLRRWEEVIADGAKLLGAGRPAGRRLDETREFLGFLRAELPGLLDRWREREASKQPDE